MNTAAVDDAARVLADPSAYADDERLHTALRQLLAVDPVAWVDYPPYRPFWPITKHTDILAIERDNDLFISAPRLTSTSPRWTRCRARSPSPGPERTGFSQSSSAGPSPATGYPARPSPCCHAFRTIRRLTIPSWLHTPSWPLRMPERSSISRRTAASVGVTTCAASRYSARHAAKPPSTFQLIPVMKPASGPAK